MHGTIFPTSTPEGALSLNRKGQLKGDSQKTRKKLGIGVVIFLLRDRLWYESRGRNDYQHQRRKEDRGWKFEEKKVLGSRIYK